MPSAAERLSDWLTQGYVPPGSALFKAIGNVGGAAKSAFPKFLDNDSGLKGLRYPMKITPRPSTFNAMPPQAPADPNFDPIAPITPLQRAGSVDPGFEPIAPVANYGGSEDTNIFAPKVDVSYGAPEKIYERYQPPENPSGIHASLFDAVKSAYPKFKEEANNAPIQALQDMSKRSQENPAGYVTDAMLGGVGAPGALATIIGAGSDAAKGIRLGTVGGALAKGFNEAKDAGKVFQGLEGAPKFEFSDLASSFKEMPKYFQGKKLSEVMDHPELFKQYPDLANVEIQKMLPTLENYDKAGQFTKVDGKPVIRIRADATPSEAKSTLLHEIQHAIQDKEGFGQGTHGGSEGYDANPGEMEARGVQGRMGMSQAALDARPIKDFLSKMERMRS